MIYNDFERKLTLHNDNDEEVVLTVCQKGVEFYVAGYNTLPGKSISFTHDEFDDALAEIKRVRESMKLITTLTP